MNKLILTLFSLSTLITSCHAQQRDNSFEPIAVVELFTSEGCSSCPPADKLLAKYDRDSIYQGVKIFPLSFHVDYWNYIGWQDPFSSPLYSDRQKMYVDALGLNGAYTPQMIVNGFNQFVGSDENSLQNALSHIPKQKSPVSFSKLDLIKSNGSLEVQYSLLGDVKGCEIHFALVSLHESIAVKKGENTGRKLSHTNVVRQFKTLSAGRSGQLIFENLPSDASDNSCVIAYVQRSDDKHIIAAAKSK